MLGDSDMDPDEQASLHQQPGDERVPQAESGGGQDDRGDLGSRQQPQTQTESEPESGENQH